jgi:hypothetical protein
LFSPVNEKPGSRLWRETPADSRVSPRLFFFGPMFRGVTDPHQVSQHLSPLGFELLDLLLDGLDLQ